MVTEAINGVISKMDADMKERLERLAKEFSVMRTGRANPMMLENIKVEAYGSLVPLKQVAAVSVPEGRTLEVKPWDPSTLQDIEKAIQKADIGVNPQNDGKLVRITMPTMTEERRKDLTKVIRKMGEEFRVAVRNERHAALDKIKKAEKAKEITQDDLKGLEGRIQKITDGFIKQVDDAVVAKEKEITTI
jgi:ribosome recycling factor